MSIFESVNIAGLKLKNRLVMAAAADNLTGEGGKLTSAHINRLVHLAQGGVGLIITGGVGVHESGRSGPNTPSVDRENAVFEYKNLTYQVHQEGAKIALQLVHSGIWASHYQNSLGKEAIGASIISDDASYLIEGLLPAPGKYHPATINEIGRVVRYFAKGAAKAKEAGFDAVEIHAAHDSLLSQFLSPITNQRTDEYGGSLENRSRLHREIVQVVKDKVGDDYPLMLKLGLQDGMEGGLTLSDGVKAAELIVDAGVDILEVSQGLQGGILPETVFRPVPKDGSGYFRSWCSQLQKMVSVPLILTGGLRSLEKIEEMSRDGEADLFGLCRPFIREPDLSNHWMDGESDTAACISCNKCVIAIGKGMPLDCYVEEKLTF